MSKVLYILEASLHGTMTVPKTYKEKQRVCVLSINGQSRL